MKVNSTIHAVLAGCGVLFCACRWAVAASATNVSAPNHPQSPPVLQTNFVADAQLTPEEVADVVLLSKKCGIEVPGQVSTFYWQPAGGRGVLVKSVERVQDRDVRVDELTIGRVGWTDLSPARGANKVGKFWAVTSDKFTRHLRMYEFRGKPIRVEIGDGIKVEMADKILALIAAKKVRFRSQQGVINPDEREMAQLIEKIPCGLVKSHDGALWLQYEGRGEVLQFRFEKGEIIADRVFHLIV